MPFTSGTAKTPTHLLYQLNTFLVANGWIKLRGEEDLRTDSPISARYWRLVQITSADGDNRHQLTQFEMRETPGGANLATDASKFSAASREHGNFEALIDPSLSQGFTAYNTKFDYNWTQYDFETPVTIREIALAVDDSRYTIERFHFQWSNDGSTWTTMLDWKKLPEDVWPGRTSKVFTFDDGYRDPIHPDLNIPRRTGGDSIFDNRAEHNHGLSHDQWAWQGNGYDAARRVYIWARTYYDLDTNSQWIQFTTCTNWDGQLKIEEQEGYPLKYNYHMMSADEFNYWIFLNNKRLILVTASSINFYGSTYIGFLSAFSNPDQYPFPLYFSSTSPNFRDFNSVNSDISSMCDPGGGRVRLWDNNWGYVSNRPSNSGVEDDYNWEPNYYVWPYHFGYTDDKHHLPVHGMGNANDFRGHWLDRINSTVQGEIPIIPCIVVSKTWGNLGALDGVFAIPGSNQVVPTQRISFGGNNYIIFPSWDRRDGHHFFAVRED